MAWALVGTAAAVSQGAASAAVTPAWGTSQNRTANNLLVCFVGGTGVATLPATPSGWSIAKQQAGTSCSSTIFWKKAAGADVAPTIALATSAIWSVQLAEFSGNPNLVAVDKSGGTSGTASPSTATLSGLDNSPGDLVLGCWSEYRSMTATSTYTVAFNNGATATNTSNTGTSTQSHYGFSWGITTGNASADTYSVSGFSTSQLTGTANAAASFPLPPVGAVSMSGTAGLTPTATATYFNTVSMSGTASLQAGPRPIALVSAGPLTPASGGAVSPTFGQSTTAGNLLVCMIANPAGQVTINSNPGTAWFQATSGNNAQIWYRQNCLSGESAPTFSTNSSAVGQLLEYSGIQTIGRIFDAQSTRGGTTSPVTVTASHANAAATGELVLACVCNAESSALSSHSLSLNNATMTNTASAPASLPAYLFAYGFTTDNTSPDSATYTWSGGTGPNATVSLVSFLPNTVAPATSPYLASVGLVNSGGTSASPLFGRATVAGNLLVAFVAMNSGGGASCSDGTWSDTGGAQYGNMIWYKANCGTNETAPTFTGTAATYALLAEFAGVATTSPLDREGNSATTINPATLNLTGGLDAAPGELYVSADGLTCSIGAVVTSDQYNNGAASACLAYNDALNLATHYRFAWGVTASNGSLGQNVISFTGGTPFMSGKMVSFKSAAAQIVTGAVSLSGTAGMTVAGRVSPPISTLVDDFSVNGTPDTTKWTTSGANVTVTGQQLQITAASGTSQTSELFSGSSPNYDYFDLTNSSITVKLVDAGTQDPNIVCIPISLQDKPLNTGPRNSVSWQISNGTIKGVKETSGSSSNISLSSSYTVNKALYAWLRIREASGTLYFDSSADGITWLNRGTTTSTDIPTIATLNARVQVVTTNSTQSATCLFDNINVLPITGAVSETATTSMSIGAISAPFDPTNLVGWYDAAAITGLSNGAAVASWPDKSPLHNDMTQAATIQRPIYYNSTPGRLVNGLPAVWFDGSDDAVAETGTLAASQSSIFAVFMPVGIPVANGMGVVGSDRGTQGAKLGGVALSWQQKTQQRDGGNGTMSLEAFNAGGGGTVNNDPTNIPGSPTATSQPPVYQSAFGVVNDRAGTNTIKTYLNTNTPTTTAGALSPTSAGPFSIGGINLAGGSGAFRGPICELLVFNAAVSASTASQVMAYLTSKWVPNPTVMMGNADAKLTIGGATGPGGSVTMSATAGMTASGTAAPAPTGGYVQGNAAFFSGTWPGSLSSTFTSNVTAGNLIVVACGWVEGGTASMSDSQGNSYTLVSNYDDTAIGYSVEVFTAIAGSTGPDTVTMTLISGAFVRLLIHEYAGFGQTVDNYSVAHVASGGTTATGTVTSSVAGDLIFAWVVDNNSVNTFTAPATMRQQIAVEATGDYIAGAAGSQTITANTSGGGGPITTVAFRPGGPSAVGGAVAMSGVSGMNVVATAGPPVAPAPPSWSGVLAAPLGFFVLSAPPKLPVAPIVTGAFAATATAGLTVAGTVTEVAAVSQSATAGMTVTATRVVPAAAPLSATAGMTVGAAVTEVASVSMASAASMTVVATRVVPAAVTMSGTAGVTVAATVTEVASVAMSGTAGLTASAAVTEVASVSMSGTAGMTVTAAPMTTQATVVMSGTAGMTATASVTQVATVSESASSLLTVAASVTEVASVSMAGSTTLTAAGLRTVLGSVALSATAGLTASAAVTQVASVALAGNATMSVAPAQVWMAAATLSASAAMTVTATTTQFLTANLSGTAGLTVTSTVTQVAAVALAGTAGLTVVGTRVVLGGVTLSGTAGLTVAAAVTQVASVSMSGTAGLTPTATVTEVTSVSMSGTGILAIAAAGQQVGSVTLSATAGVTITALVTELASVTLSATAGLLTSAAVTQVASVAMSGIAGLTAAPSVTYVFTVPMTAASSLTVSVAVTQLASVALTGNASLNVTTTIQVLSSVALAATTDLEITTSVTQVAAISWSGSSTLTVNPTATYFASVGLSGDAQLTIAAAGQQTATVSISASAGMAVAALVTQVAAVNMSGTANLTVSAAVTQVASVVMVGSSALVVAAAVTEIASVAMSVTSGLTALGTTISNQGVALSGSSSLTVSAKITVIAAVSMSASAVLVATPSVTASVALAGSAGLVVAGTVTTFASLAMSAAAGMTVVGVTISAQGLAMSATSGLVVSAKITVLAAVGLSGAAGLVIAATVTQVASVNLSGTSSLVAVGTWVQMASVALAGNAGLAVVGVLAPPGVNMSAGGGLIVVASVTVRAAITMTAASGLVASLAVTVTGSVLLSGTAGLLVVGTRVQFSTVLLTGDTTLTADGLVIVAGAIAMSADGDLAIIPLGTQVAAIDMSAQTALTAGGVVTEEAVITMTAAAALLIARVAVAAEVVPVTLLASLQTMRIALSVLEQSTKLSVADQTATVTTLEQKVQPGLRTMVVTPAYEEVIDPLVRGY